MGREERRSGEPRAPHALGPGGVFCAKTVPPLVDSRAPWPLRTPRAASAMTDGTTQSERVCSAQLPNDPTAGSRAAAMVGRRLLMGQGGEEYGAMPRVHSRRPGRARRERPVHRRRERHEIPRGLFAGRLNCRGRFNRRCG